MTEKTLRLKAKACLKRVEARLQAGWTQGTFARNSRGRPVRFDSPKATAFCLSGALQYELEMMEPDRHLRQRLWILIVRAFEYFTGDSFVRFNDATDRTLDEVLTATRRTRRHL